MKQRIFLAWMLIAAGMTACKKSSDSSIPDTVSGINVFLAVPGTEYDVVLDTTTLGTSLGMGESTGYHKFRAQRYTLMIYPAGNHNAAVAGGQISLRNNHYYSVFLCADRNNALRLLAAEDDLTQPSANNGKVRVVNLSDGFNATTATLTMDFYIDSIKRVGRLGFLGTSGFIEVPVGSHTRDVRYADSSLSLIGTNAKDFTVEDRKIYSWVTMGNPFAPTDFKVVEFVHDK